MNIQIENKEVGNDRPVFIVAELSANHLQDLELAKKTIRSIAQTGADAVKVQTYTPDTITIDSDKEYFQIKQGTIWDGQTLYQLYQKAYTPWEWLPELKKVAKECGLIFFSSPFDKTSVDCLEALDTCVYKIASCEITDIPLIRYVASKSKPVIISTGIATVDDVEEAVAACRSQNNDQIILLKCTSTYPAPLDDLNLKALGDLMKKFDVIVGLSDHTLTTSVPVAAVALGAKIIEKHFTFDRKLGGPDAAFSLEPQEFQLMVQSVREVESALGNKEFCLTEAGKNSRKFCRSLFVVKDIKKGEIFQEQNIRSIRPGYGLPPKFFDKVIGKKAKIDIVKGTPLSWELVKS